MSEGVNDDLLGCFVPFERPEYVLDSVKRGLSYGAKTIMFYLYPPRRLGAPNLENLRFDEYLQGELASLLPTNRIVIHAPYVINPASDNPKIKENTISTLRAQLALMSKVDLSLYVLHPGSYVNQTKEAGIDNLVELLSGLLGEFPSVTIALETMAGKGKQLCSTLEELAEIIRRVDRDNLGICIDTCHL